MYIYIYLFLWNSYYTIIINQKHHSIRECAAQILVLCHLCVSIDTIHIHSMVLKT